MSLPPDRSEDDLLAAEYALRLLDADAILAVRGRLANERALKVAVEAWEGRFAGMLDEAMPVEPDAGTWTRIAERLWPQRQLGVVVPFKRKPSRWLVIGAVALAASIALVVGIWTVNRPEPAPVTSTQPARPLFASIAPEGGPALANARYDIAGRVLVVTPAALTATSDQSNELWVIPADGRPRSLGLIAPGPALRIVLADDLAAFFAAEPTLAISTEVEGGSRTGSPSGPVVGTAKLLPAARPLPTPARV